MSNAIEFFNYLRTIGAIIEPPSKQIGGNSKIFKLSLNQKSFILKVYFGEKERINRSRTREIESLNFLRINGFVNVPKVYLEYSPDDGICLEYLPGETPGQNETTNREILKSFRSLKLIYDRELSFPNAIDAAFSTSDLINQIEVRLQQSKLLHIEKLFKVSEGLKRRNNIMFPKSSLTYSFSDVGSHNLLSDGLGFWFIDLEFFGKDSALKMIADYLLHPKNVFTAKMKDECFTLLKESFDIERDLFATVIPFCAAKWATIVAKKLHMKVSENHEQDEKAKVRLNQYIDLASMYKPVEIYRKLDELI